uniref:Uncharacterized protein n=1 Tax=Plectus sambesii TaxID=2011161 RepID=A0A914X3K8_9BILA
MLWECCVRKDPTIMRFLQTTRLNNLTHTAHYYTDEEVLADILDGHLQGFILANWSTPEEKRALYSPLPPFFVHRVIGGEEVSECMRRIADDHGAKISKQRTLCAVWSAEQILLHTGLVRFYLSKGMICSGISLVIEMNFSHPFKKYVIEQTEKRSEYQAAGNEIGASVSKCL